MPGSATRAARISKSAAEYIGAVLLSIMDGQHQQSSRIDSTEREQMRESERR